MRAWRKRVITSAILSARLVSGLPNNSPLAHHRLFVRILRKLAALTSTNLESESTLWVYRARSYCIFTRQEALK